MRSRTAWAAASAFLVVLCGAPATAGAATAGVEQFSNCNGDIACSKYAGGSPALALTLVAEGAERNVLRIERGVDRLTIRDEASELTAGPGCERPDPNTVTCSLSSQPPLAEGTITLGGGDDVLAVMPDLGAKLRIDGGDGADEIAGAGAADLIVGGPGVDRMSGGDGDDRFTAEDGSVYGLDGTGDVIDGGEGFDRLSVSGPEPIVAESRPEPSSTLKSVEALIGGDGDDRLTGGADEDELAGSAGDDVLDGGAGEDNLDAGPGRDQVDGGADADRIALADGDADILRCGAGRDVVGEAAYDDQYGVDVTSYSGADREDVLAPDCELILLGVDTDAYASIRAQPRGGRRATLENPCRVFPRRAKCKGTVRMRLRGAGRTKRIKIQRSTGKTVRLGRVPRATGGWRVELRISLKAGGDAYGVAYRVGGG